MGKRENQRLKLLYIAEILSSESDEKHPITMPKLIEALYARGIEAERKSIYEDLDALRNYGLDIVHASGRYGGYFLASRRFELAELKLLADAAASSKFITEKKTMELINKLTMLTSRDSGKELKRQLYVTGRTKHVNEKIYYMVDTLHRAIDERVRITFLYYHYNSRKEKVYTNDGKLRTVSPYALCWDDENYYLVAYNPDRQRIVHFRVDRMENVSILSVPIEPMPSDFHLATYIGQRFGMFAGEEQDVTLRFDNSLAEIVIDRFGQDVMMIPDGDNSFTSTVSINVGPPFYGWLFQFGSNVEIVSPAEVRQEYLKKLKESAKMYK